MSNPERTFIRNQDPTLTAALRLLGPDSYTAHRLQHANAEHLYLTSRRCFIGPIPEGWLKSHRKLWYKHYLGIHHSSKAPSFSADANTGSQRRMTGVDGPAFKPSFPQPDDAATEGTVVAKHGGDDGDGDAASGTNTQEATTETPPALAMPRARSNPKDTPLKEDAHDAEDIMSSYNSAPSHACQSVSPDNSLLPAGQSSGASGPRLGRRKTSRSSYVTAASDLSDLTETQPEAVPDSETSTPTAEEPPAHGPSDGSPNLTRRADQEAPTVRDSAEQQNNDRRLLLGSPEMSGPHTSTTSLLRTQHQAEQEDMSAHDGSASATTNGVSSVAKQVFSEVGAKAIKPSQVRFNLPDIKRRRVELQIRAKLVQAGRKRLPRSLTRGRLQNGEIVKMEKMLVRVDITSGPEKPENDFDEKDSQRVETRVTEKWREYQVVCRESGDEDAILALQMYQTRVIPATSQNKTKKRFKHEIILDRKNIKVNLYSSLDKTIVLWTPKGPRTLIYFLRTRSGTDAVEWYHFLRQVLGHHRAKTLQINVPDLSVSIRLENPFDKLEGSEDIAQAAEGDEEAIAKVLQQGQGIADKLVEQCLTMLSNSGEWSGVLEKWANYDHVGLAWKRYDRLEWIHGVNEQRMYGTIAMQKTHELELRVKQHYPLTVRTHKDHVLTEPPPVEGFLIRLTSQKGVDQKFGKLFFKRLYFTTQDRYLLFVRPAKAMPPPPPKMPMQGSSGIPSAKQIADKVPLMYAVNPFPYEDDKIAWLSSQHVSTEEAIQHDLDASDEANRNAQTMLDCDGFINLCDVIEVRKLHRGASPADDQVDEGPDVDFDVEVTDSRHDDGKTTEMDDDRTFELLLNNGLVIRLQAFSKATKKEWMRRLRDLVQYWTHRTKADMDLFKSVRQQNLRALNIDERAEAYIGQFAQKWEVTKSYASPELYNMCGISNCRTIHNSGMLFRKPRKHSTFTKCYVVLCHGHLIIFRDALRSSSGKRETHIHHDRIASIDLADVYLYSGLITEDDLLYQNQTFDSNAPGSHALPRMFLEDHWTSTDEDAMTCFVIWHSQRKGWFRSNQEVDDIRNEEADGKKTTLKRVNQLGVKGRSIVFKARSRAERDHWVLGISAEIERLGRKDDVRVVDETK